MRFIFVGGGGVCSLRKRLTHFYETYNKPYSAFIGEAHCAFYSQLCVTIETVK